MLGKPMDGVSLKVEEVQPDAELEVIGRADNSINRSGYLVLLTDIEKMLEKLPTVKQVVVVTMEKENMQGQQLAAFCMLQGDAQLSPEQIREQCFDLLPHYAHPERIGVVDAFPILPSVKIDRQALRSQTTG